ncbi:hypothetical protein J2Y45_003882 [Dyadobacter sp. BE34]|uniref:ATP-binding protein n=1 Tax=Dyadobacter fermentans TaxID=94254 RepID=A0ABU1R150_9BACT|nr:MULTISPECIES: hypothetical protein [Dyadobacter]MDR6806690.1 hypothetical protein [Dyadobacter fermentans]MDR7044432.1 hypothetical protein [Dyadobacter sp. BE242]MDR7198742.1 hypothetical protein [Dyadobacter sp. BE34]MDR7216704.1 hypothetical protein [Dyadobacter sp. BE31]MDR7263770.1 hypothetical protein [Dyadobacter sp. BE32]
MQTDVKGKINEKKLAFSNTLLPLFEAVVNSIQAIEEETSTKPGIVRINIVRSEQETINFGRPEILPEISDFHIEDNGVGFNEKNFESFNYAHSTYKFGKGGKGIGRFTWLRAFGRAEVESHFFENQNWHLRKFNFEPTRSGIEKHTIHVIDEAPQRQTIVKLRNLKQEYRKWCNNNPEDIALKIIEHCFIYFINKQCPRIIIKDLGNEIVVNDLFTKFTNGQVKTKEVKIRDNVFKLNVVKLYSNKLDNKIHYCANTREVLDDKISIDIPELDDFLYDAEGNKFSIAIYVEGAYLDANVNDERTSISFSKGEIDFPDQTSQEELRKTITEKIHSDFSEQIDQLSLKRVEKVREFVNRHPRYRQLLKYKPNELKRIPSTLNDEKLEIELFKVQQALELEVKQEVTLELKFINNEEDSNTFNEEKQALYSKIIEVGNSKLSEYVIHRKLVLDLFQKLLNERATERAVHNLIFPLQSLSDEIGFEDHNLWMIDDKLSYHKYLASDKSFKKIDSIKSDSNDRPDIIIFNHPFVFSNDSKPYESIVLIEFKRPMRDDYLDDENPIQQINKYAREIIDGEAKDKNNREFGLRSNTPIYAYIICDLTKKLQAYAKDGGYRLLPGGDGYFAFNDNYNMYVEIMSFDKILKDSKERNRVLFEKLNIG